MFCSKCGKEVHEGARFCPQCGNSLLKDTIHTDHWENPGCSTDCDQSGKTRAGQEHTADSMKVSPKVSPDTGGKRKVMIVAAVLLVLLAAAGGICAGALFTGRGDEKALANAGLTSSAVIGREERELEQGTDGNKDQHRADSSDSVTAGGIRGEAGLEGLSARPYAADYRKILQEYMEGKRGVTYGMDVGSGGRMRGEDRVGENPDTGAYEYYFLLYDGNQDGMEELYVASRPVWWGGEYIAEGIYSYLDGKLTVSLDRTDDSEYNNYYSFVKDMIVKSEQRSGGSWSCYYQLDSRGALQEETVIWWSANGMFTVDGAEVTEQEAAAQDFRYNQPAQASWILTTSENIEKHLGGTADDQSISSVRPVAPSKHITDMYQDDMDRLGFFGSNWDNGSFSILDKGDCYEVSEVVIYRFLYLDTGLVRQLKPGDSLTLQGITYTVSEIRERESYDTAYPVYGVTLSGPSNDIHTLHPAPDGKHYIVYGDSDDALTEEVYHGAVWIRKDATIQGIHPFTFEVVTCNAQEYLEMMKSADQNYISVINFEVDSEGYMTYVGCQIAG